jgi:hypothetical protein
MEILDKDSMRIEYHTLPDKYNKCAFTLYWMADYHPGHPDGEYRTAERGQVFYADPREHGFPLPIPLDITCSM